MDGLFDIGGTVPAALNWVSWHFHVYFGEGWTNMTMFLKDLLVLLLSSLSRRCPLSSSTFPFFGIYLLHKENYQWEFFRNRERNKHHLSVMMSYVKMFSFAWQYSQSHGILDNRGHNWVKRVSEAQSGLQSQLWNQFQSGNRSCKTFSNEDFR